MPSKGAVSIQIKKGVDLHLEQNQLSLVSLTERGLIVGYIEIGPATKKKIDELKEYLDRIRVHCD